MKNIPSFALRAGLFLMFGIAAIILSCGNPVQVVPTNYQTDDMPCIYLESPTVITNQSGTATYYVAPQDLLAGTVRCKDPITVVRVDPGTGVFNDAQGTTNWQYPLDNLASGKEYLIRFYAKTIHNRSSRTQEIAVTALSRPTVTITSHSNHELVNGLTNPMCVLQGTASVDGNDRHIQKILVDTGVGVYTQAMDATDWSIPIAGLPGGRQNIRVYAIDSIGVYSKEKNLNIVVSTNRPEIVIIEPTNKSFVARLFTIRGTASVEGGRRITKIMVDPGTGFFLEAIGTKIWNKKFHVLDYGTFPVRVYALDNFGCQSKTITNTITTVSAQGSIYAIRISGLALNGSSGCHLEWDVINANAAINQRSYWSEGTLYNATDRYDTLNSTIIRGDYFFLGGGSESSSPGSRTFTFYRESGSGNVVLSINFSSTADVIRTKSGDRYILFYYDGVTVHWEQVN